MTFTLSNVTDRLTFVWYNFKRILAVYVNEVGSGKSARWPTYTHFSDPNDGGNKRGGERLTYKFDV
jgi:hypothetical protein